MHQRSAAHCNCVARLAGDGPYSVRKALSRNKHPERGQIESEVVALLSVCKIGERRSRMAERTNAEAMDARAEKASAGRRSASLAGGRYESGSATHKRGSAVLEHASIRSQRLRMRQYTPAGSRVQCCLRARADERSAWQRCKSVGDSANPSRCAQMQL